jgi:hypothetical protein
VVGGYIVAYAAVKVGTSVMVVVDFRGVCEVRDRYNNMEFYVCKQNENYDTKADRLFHENSGV